MIDAGHYKKDLRTATEDAIANRITIVARFSVKRDISAIELQLSNATRLQEL